MKKVIHEEGTPMPEREPEVIERTDNEWFSLVEKWADKSNVRQVALRLQTELAREGIVSVDQVPSVPIAVLAKVARAALQADAQALQAAAFKMLQGGS